MQAKERKKGSMISVQEIGSQKLYDAILSHIKETVSFFKRISMKGLTKKAAQECDGLYLRDLELTDLEFLRFFPNLKGLMLANITGLQNVDGLRNCPNLTDFEMFDTTVYDLSGVRYCLQLDNLSYIPDQSRETSMDLSFLQDLSKLEGLEMVDCNISDISPISRCKALCYLDLSGNPIKSIKPLSELPLLEELNLPNCNLETLEDLSAFPALVAMTLHGNPFSQEEKERLRSLYPEIHFGFESGEVDG